jgi:hypothetical protein
MVSSHAAQPSANHSLLIVCSSPLCIFRPRTMGLCRPGHLTPHCHQPSRKKQPSHYSTINHLTTLQHCTTTNFLILINELSTTNYFIPATSYKSKSHSHHKNTPWNTQLYVMSIVLLTPYWDIRSIYTLPPSSLTMLV